LSARRNARYARSVSLIAAIAFAVDQQINRSKKLSTGPDIRRNTWYKRRPSNWRIDDGFEKEEGDATRMVEEGYGRPQVVGEAEDAGANDRPPPQALGRRGAAKGLCGGHFLEPAEAAPAQAGEVEPVGKTGFPPATVERHDGTIM
jgi:hypothetical protein